MTDTQPSRQPSSKRSSGTTSPANTAPDHTKSTTTTRNYPKNRAPRKDASAKILKKYERMWDAYQHTQSGNYLVTTCGVHWSTARRAITEGWPRYGLPPLRDRWLSLRRKAHDIADYNAAMASAEALAHTRALDQTLFRMIETFRQQLLDWRGDELRKLKGPQVVAMLERLYGLVQQSLKLKEQVLGPSGRDDPDLPAGQQILIIERIRTMPDDQLNDILRRGGLADLLALGDGKGSDADVVDADVVAVDGDPVPVPQPTVINTPPPPDPGHVESGTSEAATAEVICTPPEGDPLADFLRRRRPVSDPAAEASRAAALAGYQAHETAPPVAGDGVGAVPVTGDGTGHENGSS